MKTTGMPAAPRILFLLALLASNAWCDGTTIQLNGYLDNSATSGVVRRGFRIITTDKEMSVSLQQRVLGTSQREAIDMSVEFKITDDNVIREWRKQALVAFRQSPVRRKQTVETRLPSGYWAIYVKESSLLSQGDPTINALGDDASIKLVTTTLLALDQMIERKDYQQISFSRSEGDMVLSIQLSLGEILADPQKWDGKRVKVAGWFSHGEEKSVLYPSRFYAWIKKRGVWVGENSTIATEIDHYPEKYEGRREIEGVVRASKHGHWGGFPCTIDRLTINRVR